MQTDRSSAGTDLHPNEPNEEGERPAADGGVPGGRSPISLVIAGRRRPSRGAIRPDPPHPPDPNPRGTDARRSTERYAAAARSARRELIADLRSPIAVCLSDPQWLTTSRTCTCGCSSSPTSREERPFRGTAECAAPG